MKNSSDSRSALAGSDSFDDQEFSARWRRVSPIATAYFAFDLLKGLVNLWPALVGVWAGGPSIRELFWDYGIYLLGFLYVLFVFLEYWFFRFQEQADRIQLQRGVFKRKRLTLYYDRVQQADISQPYYFRPFGLATLGLESAGSSQQEVDLPGLAYREAEKLKTRILEYQKSTSSDLREGNTGCAQAAGFNMVLPPAELARYGLMHNGLLFLLPLTAPIWQHLDIYTAYLESLLKNSPLFAFLQDFVRAGTLTVALGVVFTVLIGLALLFAVSVAIGLVRFWNYELVGGHDHYQYRAGLLTVRTRGFRLHKLQKVTVHQGLFARWLKRYSLSISKAGRIVRQQDGDSRVFLVPVLDGERLAQIKRQLKLPEPHWTQVSRLQFWFRGIAKGLVFALLAGVLLATPLASAARTLLAGMGVFLLCLLASRRYWRRFGYYHDEKWLVVSSGFIGRTLVYIPTGKVQKIQLSQPPWLKWFGLAHLVIWSGDGKVHVPYLPRGTAAAIRDHLLRSVVTFRGRWF